MIRHYYGLETRTHAWNIAQRVAQAFGGRVSMVTVMIVETGCAETHLGRLKDRHPDRLGVGWLQCDEIALVDVKQRTRERDREIMHGKFGYDLDKVELADLSHDPLLAALICRLHYKLVPERFPDDLLDRGSYWKRHYNKSGAGSAREYVERVEAFLED